MVQPEHQREAHGNFGGGHGQDEEEHHLAVGLAPAGSCNDKAEAGCIEHHLNRHQRKYHVAAGQQSGQPQREQDGRQQECVPDQVWLHRQFPFLQGL